MDDEILSLIEQMRQEQQGNNGISVTGVQQLSQGLLSNSNNSLQALQKNKNTGAQLANNMVAQGQQQTQEAMQSKNALMNQQANLATQTEQQALSAAQQAQQSQQGGGLGALLKLGAMIASGGGAAAGAESAVGSQMADMSWKDLGKNGFLNWF